MPKRLRLRGAIFNSPSEKVVGAAVEMLLAALPQEPDPDPRQLIEILEVLYEERHFDLLVRAATACVAAGLYDPRARILLARALLHQHKPTEAVGYLAAIEHQLAESADPSAPACRDVVLELLGDTYVRLILDAHPTAAEPRAEDRERADTYYERGLRLEQRRRSFHAIKRVRLEVLAARVTGAFERPLTPRGRNMAEFVVKQLEAAQLDTANLDGGSLGDESLELIAAACEAQLALGGDLLTIIPRLDFVAAHAGADLLDQLREQYRELWRLADDVQRSGPLILALFDQASLLRGHGLELDATRKQLRVVRREIPFPGGKLEELEHYAGALQRARGVASLRPVGTHTGVATGAFVRGEDVHPRFQGKALVVTNAHVAAPDRLQAGTSEAMDPRRVLATLENIDGAPTFRAVECLWWSADLDISILELEAAAVQHLASAALEVSSAAVELRHRVCIIGHPGGRHAVVSMKNSEILDVTPRRLSYRLTTQDGMSGSPIFDVGWRLVGVHIGVRADRAANIGAPWAAIRRALDQREVIREGASGSDDGMVPLDLRITVDVPAGSLATIVSAELEQPASPMAATPDRPRGRD